MSCSKKDNDKFINGTKISIEQYDSLTIENLATLCKVCGFLKYYHPEVASGKYNWDYELFRIMPNVIHSKSVQERNIVLYNWINRLAEVKASSIPFISDTMNIKLYPDIDWIENRSLLGDVIKQLVKIKNAKRSEKNYYVRLSTDVQNPIFTNEEEYSQFEYPDIGYRLLALFR